MLNEKYNWGDHIQEHFPPITNFISKPKMSSTTSDSFHGNPEAAAGSPLHESPGDSNPNPPSAHWWYGQYYPVAPSAHGWYGQYHPVAPFAPFADGWYDQCGHYHPHASPTHYHPYAPPTHNHPYAPPTHDHPYAPPTHNHPFTEQCDSLRLSATASSFKPSFTVKPTATLTVKPTATLTVKPTATLTVRPTASTNSELSLKSQSCRAYHDLEKRAKRNMLERNWSIAADLFRKTDVARKVHRIRFELSTDDGHRGANAFCVRKANECVRKAYAESRVGVTVV